ncbi:hypothetical protein LGR44_01745 [Microvirga sp. SM9]|nr:hypothetical protein [Microvirga lenta]
MYQGNDGAPELPSTSPQRERLAGAGEHAPQAPYLLRSSRSAAAGTQPREHGLSEAGQTRSRLEQPQARPSSLREAHGTLSRGRGDAARTIGRVVGAVRRHFLLAAAIAIGMVVLTTGIVLSLAEKYTATALLVVDQRDLRLLGLDTPAPAAASPNVDSEVEIMKSPSIAQEVASRLNLASDPRFVAGAEGDESVISQFVGGTLNVFKSSLQSGFGMLGDESVGPEGQDALESGKTDPNAIAARALQRITTVRRRGLTNVIAIDVTAESPSEAARLANAYAETYIDGQVRAKLRSAERAEAALTERVSELGEALRRSETQIKAFAMAQASQPNDDASRRDVDRVQGSIASTTRELNSLTTRLREIEGFIASQNYASLGQSLSIPEMVVMDEQRRTLEQRIQRPSEGDRERSDLRQRLELVNSQLQALSAQRIEPIRRQFEAGNERLASLRQELERVIQRTDPSTDISVNLFRLQQEAASTRQLYQEYLGRLKALAQQRNIVSPDVHVVAAASAPPVKSFPPRTILVLLGGAAGLVLAVGAAYARDNYPANLKSEDELEEATGLRCSAIVPAIKRGSGRGGIAPEDEIFDRPTSEFSEAIRRLRVSIAAGSSESFKSLLVTSSHPAEGKSTIALSLARTAAEAGLKVALLDCNFRDPVLHSRLGLDNRNGLAQLLLSPGVISAPLISADPRSTCSVITSGDLADIPPDRPLQSARLGKILRELGSNFDLIVLDTPSAGLVADPLMLVHHVDAVLVVARAGRTAPENVRSLVDEVTHISNKNVFTALNFAS